MQSVQNHQPTIASAKTRKQIAQEYNIDVRTLRRWLKKFNLDIPSGSICPKHQQVIYETFGAPRI